jgi:hypothetical protein
MHRPIRFVLLHLLLGPLRANKASSVACSEIDAVEARRTGRLFAASLAAEPVAEALVLVVGLGTLKALRTQAFPGAGAWIAQSPSRPVGRGAQSVWKHRMPGQSESLAQLREQMPVPCVDFRHLRERQSSPLWQGCPRPLPAKYCSSPVHRKTPTTVVMMPEKMISHRYRCAFELG